MMDKYKKLIIQMIKFGGVGAFCFVIDFVILFALTELFGQEFYLLFAGISFTVSVVVNYILSVKYVFDVNSRHSKKQHFILFLIFSIIGLGLTELLMWVGVDLLTVNYMIAKILSAVIVTVYNFITKKLSLEKL